MYKYRKEVCEGGIRDEVGRKKTQLLRRDIEREKETEL